MSNDTFMTREYKRRLSAREQAQLVVRLKRCELALEYRAKGFTYRQIAEALCEAGYPISARQVMRDIQAAIETARDAALDKVEQLRALEALRLDFYLRMISDKISSGNERAIELAVKISARRSELLGLDAPRKVEQKHSGAVGVIPFNPAEMTPEQRREKLLELMGTGDEGRDGLSADPWDAGPELIVISDEDKSSAAEGSGNLDV